MADMVGRDQHWITCNYNFLVCEHDICWKLKDGCGFNVNRTCTPHTGGPRFAAQVGVEETRALDGDDLHKRYSD
jgi:hypothetical protein